MFHSSFVEFLSTLEKPRKPFPWIPLPAFGPGIPTSFGHFEIGCPKRRIADPLMGFTSDSKQDTSVVLPHPEGPRSPKIWPLLTERVALFRTRFLLPYSTLRSRTSTAFCILHERCCLENADISRVNTTNEKAYLCFEFTSAIFICIRFSSRLLSVIAYIKWSKIFVNIF